ncbi:hypothetical protein JG688_00004878 [Phytophthora aleatoria]|uniref:Uncharacterized protein n=1 Tax=Phytophthora aleatoria TaxID=2496075 RepID=A0A8J5IW03_9STRA|nr:hypothetical protein JG688_00004878 [Phytophthora aleatoria]
MGKDPKHGLAAPKRVLSAHEEGRDWELVASCNDIPPTTARNIVQRGTSDVKKRGGARAACTKLTPEMEELLVEYCYCLGQCPCPQPDGGPCTGYSDLELPRLGPYSLTHVQPYRG